MTKMKKQNHTNHKTVQGGPDGLPFLFCRIILFHQDLPKRQKEKRQNAEKYLKLNNKRMILEFDIKVRNHSDNA